MGQFQVVRRDALSRGPATAGMDRRTAIEGDGVWTGVVRTPGGVTSDWHHHGEHDTYAYILEGTARFEIGGAIFEVNAGDFALVPKGAVHRESNPGDSESVIIIMRLGGGPTVVNVDGPNG